MPEGDTIWRAARALQALHTHQGMTGSWHLYYKSEGLSCAASARSPAWLTSTTTL